ncbi:hypothetical protein GCM10009779_23670 [Polymorphospora rubra]
MVWAAWAAVVVGTVSAPVVSTAASASANGLRTESTVDGMASPPGVGVGRVWVGRGRRAGAGPAGPGGQLWKAIHSRTPVDSPGLDVIDNRSRVVETVVKVVTL